MAHWTIDADAEISALLTAHKSSPKEFYAADKPAQVKALVAKLDALKARLAPLPNDKL